MSSFFTKKLIADGFKPVTLEDKDLIKSYFIKENSNFSDYSFTVLFSWSAYKTIFYKLYNGVLIIARVLRSKFDFLYPPLGASDAVSFAAAVVYCASLGREIYYDRLSIRKDTGASFEEDKKKDGVAFKILGAGEDKLDYISAIEMHGLKCDSGEDLFDYIYDYKMLIEMAGKKYKNKRENINKFIRSYPDYSLETIGRENKEENLDFLKRWYVENRPGRTIPLSELFDIDVINYEKNFILESYQCRKVLLNYEKLNLKGLCIKIYSRIVGFIIGEATNSDTFTVLIEKVDNNFFGLSQFLFREFLLANAGFKYVNTSDDSGMPGLKVLKESYQPLYMKKRYYLKVFCI